MMRLGEDGPDSSPSLQDLNDINVYGLRLLVENDHDAASF
jgi:hypothetical protein